MWLTSLWNLVSPKGQHSQDQRRDARVKRATPRMGRLQLEELECRALPSTLQMAVIGDSLSAPYESIRAASGDLSWVQQLQSLDSNKVTIDSVAFSGATTNSLFQSSDDSDGHLHSAEVPAVLNLIAHHDVHDVVLMIGANDVSADLPLVFTSGPAAFVSTFVTTVVGNIETALTQLAHAGHVNLVVSDLPDVTVTPYFQATAAPLTQLVELAITTANQQIESFAASHEIPVVDLYGLTHLTQQTITVGGVAFSPAPPNPSLFTADGFHPNTVGQGLLANTILQAFHEGYGQPIQDLRLTDQEILNEPGIAQHPGLHGHTFFDVTPFVLFTDADDFGPTCHPGHPNPTGHGSH